MSRNTSMLDYVVRNWPTHGDTVLEETRQAALRELDELHGQVRGEGQTRKQTRDSLAPQALVVGRLYRGTIIFVLPTGEIFVLDESNHKYDFVTIPEAEAFVDANLELSGLLLGMLA